MTFFTPTEPTESATLRAWVENGLLNARSIVHGLSADQLRARPLPSTELTLGWLLLHIGEVAEEWIARAAAGPEPLPVPDLPLADRLAAAEHRNDVADDATAESVLAEFDRRCARALGLLADVELDASVPVPDDVPWFPPGLPAFDGRWCVHHVLTEIQRHSGHADLLREALDARSMYELIADSQGLDLSYIGAWYAAHPEVPAPAW